MSAFDRMEDKANRMLDEANAMAELNTEPVDEAKALEAKYNAAGTDASVDDELEKMKKELGLSGPPKSGRLGRVEAGKGWFESGRLDARYL